MSKVMKKEEKELAENMCSQRRFCWTATIRPRLGGNGRGCSWGGGRCHDNDRLILGHLDAEIELRQLS